MEKYSIWIMVAGPYSSGAKDEEERLRNLDRLNQAALELFKKGYLPIIGVNNALPLIKIDGKPESFNAMMMPYCEALAARCDCCVCLCEKGVSEGSDREISKFESAGKPYYYGLENVPEIGQFPRKRDFTPLQPT